MQPLPTLDREQRLWAIGYRHVAGVDEAGRGALAGPVAAAAVIVAPATAAVTLWQQVRDSKLLTPRQRAALEIQIKAAALAWNIGCVSAATIDVIGIAAATRQAMQEAIVGLCVTPDYLLIDWVRLRQVNIAQTSQAKADQQIVSVAAASILAKVHRDRLMVELDRCYPQYGFAGHKGYGAATHLAALERCGPCPEHRHSFAPIAKRACLLAEESD